MAQNISTYSGRRGVVKVGATPTAVELLRGFTVTETANTDDDSRMGEDWDRMHVLSYTWSGTITARDSPGAPAQVQLEPGAELAFEGYTTGESSGREKVSGNILITSLERAAEQAGAVERVWNFNGQGTLTKEQIA